MKRIRHAILFASAVAASPAAAQPMTRDTCAVTIVRAPQDVKNVVESWVKAEPKCNAKLEIRIVPTEGGLYLLARDEYGRLRERVVPDAQSAGVIVASWVAADSNAATPYDVRQPTPVEGVAEAAPAAMPPVAPPAAMPPGAPSVAIAPAPGAGPGAAPVVDKPAEVPQTAGRERARWFAVGAMAAMNEAGGGGVRAEWDMKNRGWATLGFAGSLSGTSMYYGDPYSGYGTIDTFDAKVLGYIGMAGTSGKWWLRATGGVGAVYTQAAVDSSTGYDVAGGVFPTGELTLSVGRELGTKWAIFAGPVVSAYLQEMNLQSTGYYSTMTVHRDVDAMFYMSARYRL